MILVIPAVANAWQSRGAKMTLLVEIIPEWFVIVSLPLLDCIPT